MANWWDAAPLAATKAAPAAGANWWEAAPLAQDAKPAEPQYDVTPGDANNPTRIAPAKRDVGMAEAVGRGAAQGATFNFYDELRGLVEAGGANPDDPASLSKLIQGAIGYWSGNKQAEQTYDQTVKRERAEGKEVEEARPYSSMAGNIAGAVAVPVGAALNAATLPGRMARGAGVGAVTGAAYGAGEGDGAIDRLARAGSGAAVGGALGGAAPPIVEGAIRGARAVSQPIANAVRGIRNPEDEAARRVALSLQRDIELDPTAANRLTPAEMVAQKQQGNPVNLMDVGGETTRALARSAANTSPEGRAALTKSIDERFEGQGPRIVSWFQKTFNYPDADSISEAIKKVAKTVNRANYERVMSKHPVVNVPSEIVERPAVAQAMKDAVSLAKNYGEKLEGDPIVKTIISGPGFHIADDVASPAKTSLRYWDYVKKAMDSRIEKMKRGGGIDDLNGKEKADYQGLLDARNTLVAHLDSVAKDYKSARAGAAAFFGAEDALEAGQKIVSSRMSNGEIARGLAKMSPEERKLAQDGFVSEYTAMLRETGDRRNVMSKIGESPAARERLNMILGPQKSKELEAVLRVEGIMDLARPAVQGNSTTARQLAELGLAGGTYGIASGGNITNPDPSALMNAALVYGAARGRNKINEIVSRRVAEMLASDDPKILMRGIKIVANNNQLFSSLRSMDSGLAKISGQQSAGVPAMQAAGVGRADNEPNVPRPPGQ